MLKLKIKKRACHVSNAMQGNTERHGNEDVGALDLALDGIVLKKADLEALLGKGAFDALYDNELDLPEVRFTMLETPLKLKTQFEGATVELWLGITDDDAEASLTFTECKVKSIELTPQAGGMTLCKLKIRTTRPDSDSVSQVFDYLNSDASVQIADAAAIEKSKDKQRDLALPAGADGEPAGQAGGEPGEGDDAGGFGGPGEGDDD